jgi:urease subunit gamma/beta
MHLGPTEEDRLRIFTAAELARRTLERGLELNAPEAIALICDEMHMAARSGATHEQVLLAGRGALSRDQLIDGVADLLSEIRLEVLLDEGTRLVVLRDPFGAET